MQNDYADKFNAWLRQFKEKISDPEAEWGVCVRVPCVLCSIDRTGVKRALACSFSRLYSLLFTCTYMHARTSMHASQHPHVAGHVCLPMVSHA